MFPLYVQEFGVEDLVRDLWELLEGRARWEREHALRVSSMAARIARVLQLEASEIEAARLAGLLHDIGKIRIPETILNKQEDLAVEERRLLECHPLFGAELLLRNPHVNRDRIFQAVLQAVLHHHEHYDGRGYPGGLSGEAIPRIARIIAVADALDSMTDPSRPYLSPLASREAWEELRRCSGTQFDPDVVEGIRGLWCDPSLSGGDQGE